MKMLKIICLSVLSIVVLSSGCLATAQEKRMDSEAEYTGRIVRSDKNFILVNITDTEKYCGIRVLDKDGFIVDHDIVQGRLLSFVRSMVFSDITQGTKFVGKVVSRRDSWEEGNRWWRLRYDLRYPN